jgi:hypothetical protein
VLVFAVSFDGAATEAPAGKIHVPGFFGDLSAACRGAGIAAFSILAFIAALAVSVGISHLSLGDSTEAFRWRSCGRGRRGGRTTEPLEQCHACAKVTPHQHAPAAVLHSGPDLVEENDLFPVIPEQCHLRRRRQATRRPPPLDKLCSTIAAAPGECR